MLAAQLSALQLGAASVSIWSNADIPPVESVTDTNAYELGVKFRSTANGYITGLRFYKGSGNTGTHTGSLWTGTGSNLATLAFTNETATGWQEQSFATPVPIVSNQTYVASYHCPNGGYAETTNYFAGQGATNPPLRALTDGEDGSNGVFAIGDAIAFPTNTYFAANYWVDVVFVDSLAPDTNAPNVTSVSPTEGATEVNVGTPVTATFNEAMNAATLNTNTFTLAEEGGGSSSVIVAATGSGGVEEDSVTPISLLTISHSTGSGDDRLMLVGLSFEEDNTADFSVTAVQWVVGAVTQALTLVIQRGPTGEATAEIWRLVNPTGGSGTVRVVVNGGVPDGDALVAGVATFSGVNQTTPLGAAVGNTGSGTTASVVVASAAGELVFDTLALDDARSATVGAGQTQRWNRIAGTANSDGIRGGASTEPGGGSVTMSWTTGSDSWAICAVPIKPASASGPIPALVSYSAGTMTATLQPLSPLNLGQTYTARVKGGGAGAQDLATNALATDYVWSFTTANQFPRSLWAGTTVPAAPSADDPNAYELGVKFQSAVNGYILGVRFYKGASNAGPHLGNLWTVAGTNLASVVFTNETDTGWQEQLFASPVAVAADTTYVVSYHAPFGGYALDSGYFTGGGHTNFPLHALPSSAGNGNGVFVPGSSAFPTDTFGDANYWVDVVFASQPGLDTNPPVLLSVSPTNGAAGVSLNAPVTVAFSEPMTAATINTNTFLLLNAASNVVPASVSYSAGSYTATLQPAGPLAPAQTYTARVLGGGPGVKDLATNALAADAVWSFATELPDAVPPTVSLVSPTNGATGVGVGAAVTITFNEAMSSATINSNTVTLFDAASNAVPAVVSYDAGGHRAILQPTDLLALSQTYTARVKGGSNGVKDLATNALAADYVWSFTVAADLPGSVWGDAFVPEVPSKDDPTAYELGVKFESAVNGYIRGIRFYKGPANTGIHAGNLWTLGGSNLASATFTNETGTGWQEQWFTAVVPILSNTTYVASYHCPEGGYAIETNYFTGTGYTNYPLRLLPSGVAGGNGVFTPGASAFPTNTFEDANYWVDVVFETSPGVDAAPFSITSITVISNMATITWESTSGQTYRLQYKTNLTDPNWIEIPDDILATGPSTGTTNLIEGAFRRFYRVK